MHGFVALFGMVQGLGWSTWLLASATGLAPSRWAFAAVAHGGLLVVTTLVFAPVPTAALALWLCLAIAATVALGPWAAPLLLPLLAVAVVMLGGISERSYVASRRWLASAAIALKASLLLGEFEESGRGWFWETDDRGLITYISPQIAAALGLPADRLLGTPMTGLVLHEAGDGAGSGAGSGRWASIWRPGLPFPRSRCARRLATTCAGGRCPAARPSTNMAISWAFGAAAPT
ncbi:PAS domain-containing protein [Rhizorhabdus histidinilytica]